MATGGCQSYTRPVQAATVAHLCMVDDPVIRPPNQPYKIGLELTDLAPPAAPGSKSTKPAGWCIWMQASGMTKPICVASSSGATPITSGGGSVWPGCSGSSTVPSSSLRSGSSRRIVHVDPDADLLTTYGFANLKRKVTPHDLVSGATTQQDGPFHHCGPPTQPAYGQTCSPAVYPDSDVTRQPNSNDTFANGTAARVVFWTPPNLPYPIQGNAPIPGMQFSGDLAVVIYIQNGSEEWGASVEDPETGNQTYPPITQVLIVVPTKGSPYGSPQVSKEIRRVSTRTCKSNADCPWPTVCSGPTETSKAALKACVNPICSTTDDCNQHGTCDPVAHVCVCDPGWDGRIDCSLAGDSNGDSKGSGKMSTGTKTLLYVGIAVGVLVIIALGIALILRHKNKVAAGSLRNAGYSVRQSLSAVQEQQDIQGDS